MNNKKRIFISFAIEDSKYRDLLVGQARNPSSPFEFVDMSVKEPWDERWKTNCRTKIKGCDGALVLVSRNTSKAEGALWEVQCAKDERIPLVGVHCTSDDRPSVLPSGMAGVKIMDWSWDGIAGFLNSLP